MEKARERTIQFLETRQKYVGQQFGDYEIVSVTYDFELNKQINVCRCVRCGKEKNVRDLAAFRRGKAEGLLCKCRFDRVKYVPKNEEYRGYVGDTINGFLLVEYRERKGFRVQCEECGKQKWASGKAVLEKRVFCDHKTINHYDDPKYDNMKIGNLTVVGREGSLFRFRCDCGTERLCRPTDVFVKTIRTCGRKDCPYHKTQLKQGSARRLRGIAFERECASQIEKQGYRVELTSESGDFGVDFFAMIDGEKVAFQCKHTKPESTVSAVQEVYAGGRYFDCCNFVVISPSGFTYPAKMMARKLGVQLETTTEAFDLKRGEKNLFETQEIQTYNKRGLIWIVDGVAKPASVWCEEYGITKSGVRDRVRRGMDIKTALTAPKYQRHI